MVVTVHAPSAPRPAAAFDIVPLITQKRPVDLFRIQAYIASRYTAGFEVVLPAVDDPRNGADLAHRVVLAKCEHLGHRQRIRERRVSLLLANTHLLVSERLPGGKDIIGGGKLISLALSYN